MSDLIHIEAVEAELLVQDTYEASISEALDWASTAEAGDYLVQYEDTGMSHDDDPGSRCGYDDAELAQIRDSLRERDLTLTADDRGLVAVAVAVRS